MLIKSGIIVAFFTMLSRIFGLARELFVASIFGSSAIADCVNIAFKFPNLFRRIFGEGALSVVFIPIFSQKLLESRSSAHRFSSEVLTLLFISLIILSTLMQIFMPYLMVLIAPGFYKIQEKYELAILLCRITTPYLIFISISAIFGGMLNSVKKFAAFAFVPIIMNICVILFTYLWQEKLNAHFAISYSLILAGILQVIFMWFCLLRAKLTFSPSLAFYDNPEVIKLLKNMGPAAISSGVQQINLFISQSIASFIPGAVSILSYAERLYQLPLAIIGVTFGTILLPELSQIYKKKDLEGANNLQNNAIIIALALSIPATLGLLLLAKPIIHLIYERGAFVAEDTSKTAYALAAFSLGLPAFVIAKILTPIFYANGDTKTPMRITVYSLLFNSFLNIALMIPFDHVGIAIGSSISAWYNVFLLGKYAKSHGNFKIQIKTKKSIYKIIISAFFMIAVLCISNYFFHDFYYSLSFVVKAQALFITIIIAAMVYLLMLYFFKIHLFLIKHRITAKTV
jgi:putative peptidoglycan lipid II flippase